MTSGADVAFAEDPFVSQDPFTGVLTVVVVDLGRGIRGLLGRHGLPSMGG